MRNAFAVGLTIGLFVALGGFVIQLFTGSGIEASIWAFPLNLILLIFIIICAVILRFGYRQSKCYNMVRHPQFSAGVITVAVVQTLVMGLVLQQQNKFGE